MSFPRYERYKDSGVEWLGEVPEHWDIFAGRRVFKNRRELASESDEQLAASQKYGVIPQSLMMGLNDSKVMLALKGTESFRHVEKDDFVISLRSFEGGIEHSNYKGCVSPAYTVLNALKNIEPNFFRHLFKSKAYVSALQATTDSLRDGKSITYQQFGDIQLVLPPVFEQKNIATFLDRETAKIDALVAEQQRLIELLKEKRQAVMSHVVTKGLNPDAPMKDSGVEWLGEIPEHWQVTPMRMIANIVRGASPRPAGDPKYFGGDAVSWVTVAEITKDDAVYLTETENFLTLEGAAHSNLFRNGTLIYSNSGATLGVPKILCIDACANDGVVAFLNLDSKVHAEFLYYYLSSITDYIRERIKQGSGQPNLNTDIVKDLRFGLPPLNEQQSITQYIQEIAEQFSLLTATAERSITLLQERRTALISAAVTGKIKVTGITE